MTAAEGRRRRLVVVASLLDRAPNLAGLTRTCEVFQAERLVLGDLRVTRTAEFRGISVTAEQHIQLEVAFIVLLSINKQQCNPSLTTASSYALSLKSAVPDCRKCGRRICLDG